jgi:hypothetical protein
MTKTREQVEEILKIEIAALEKQQAKVNRLHNQLVKMLEAEAAQQPMTVARALETFLPGTHVEFREGYEFLTDMTWKGKWKGTGLQFGGGYWSGTRQRTLKLALNYTWDTAKLEQLEKLILEVLPDMKTGNWDATQMSPSDFMIGSFSHKEEKINVQTLKLFDIFEHNLSEHGSYNLGVLDDGSAVVFETRFVSSGLEKRGTLMECLEYIRENLWYEGGEKSDDDSWY